MIKEIREQKPFIHFGFNRQNLTLQKVGNKVRVYIDGNYNPNIYNVSIDTTGTVTQVTTRIYDVDFSTSGLKNIEVTLTNTITLDEIVSNSIEAEEVYYSFDSEDITFDNAIITFDND